MRIVRKIPRTKPLLYIGDRLIVARGTTLYWADLELKEFKKITRLPCTVSQSLRSHSKLLSRVFRLQIGPAIQVDDSATILVWAFGEVYKVDIETGRNTVESISPQGRSPLSMVYNSDLDIGPAGVYFGEYFSNKTKKSAWIWYRNDHGIWSRIFEFEQGEVNHIHALTVDPYSRKFLALTGDYDHAPRIWELEPGFRKATPIVKPEQNSRACWILPEEDYLIYATDTHLAPNSIRRIKRSGYNSEKPSEKITDTIGSSIYFVINKHGQVCFSTAVEPGEPSGSKIRNILTRQWGPGIKGPQCGLYFGSSQTGFNLIYQEKVDGLPLRLFGFGAFSFPSGINPLDGKIHCYASGLKNCDGHTLLLEQI